MFSRNQKYAAFRRLAILAGLRSSHGIHVFRVLDWKKAIGSSPVDTGFKRTAGAE
jgi:hypothetical protein